MLLIRFAYWSKGLRTDEKSQRRCRLWWGLGASRRSDAAPMAGVAGRHSAIGPILDPGPGIHGHRQLLRVVDAGGVQKTETSAPSSARGGFAVRHRPRFTSCRPETAYDTAPAGSPDRPRAPSGGDQLGRFLLATVHSTHGRTVGRFTAYVRREGPCLDHSRSSSATTDPARLRRDAVPGSRFGSRESGAPKH
jgi:hypothetical protein